MGKGVFLGLLIVFVISMQFASAEIILSQPASFYNLGDTLVMTVEVSEIKSGFLEINLVCDENTKNIYNSIISKKKIDLAVPLTRTHINELAGQCKVTANYPGEQISSPVFKISNSIIINIDFEKLSVKPGQEIQIKGSASKENGGLVTGFIEIEIEDTSISVLRNVDKGNFDVKISLPKNIEGKEYNLKIKVYEKLSGETTNQGIINKILSVQQVPSKIDIIIDKQSIIPGNELGFKAILYDQANKEVSGDINIVIKNPKEEIFFSQISVSGEEKKLNVEKNFSDGYWVIEASSLNIKNKKLFYVEKKEEAEFKLDNQTLTITNTGNVPYKKSVQIAIGDELKTIELDLNVGETTSFKLIAPDGDYDVKVTDGINTFEQGKVSLTGNVIGVMNIRKAGGALGRYPIVWIFLIFIFGLFILMIINKVAKKKFASKFPDLKTDFKIKKTKIDRNKETNFEGEAEHTLVLKGNKEEAAVLALKVGDKNLTESAANQIKAGKGVIYRAEEGYLLGIFTPSLTKTLENELKAVKIAREIEKNLKAQKKNFGIGINTGNIIAEKQQGKLKFTSLGNTITLAKKIADSGKNEILLSSGSANKARNIIKTEKKGQHYTIKNIVDREKYKKFVDDFLRKNE